MSKATQVFDAVSRCQNTRSEYDGQLIKIYDLEQVESISLEPGVVLRFVLNPAEMETVLEYVHLGNLSPYAAAAFIDELIQGLRFNKRETLVSLGASLPQLLVRFGFADPIPRSLRRSLEQVII